MTEIKEWPLPGVGMSYEFTTATGTRVLVITHRRGRRDVSIGAPDDPDAFKTVLEMTEDEARILAELLGGSRITRELTRLRQAVQGLAIDWVPVVLLLAAVGPVLARFVEPRLEHHVPRTSRP